MDTDFGSGIAAVVPLLRKNAELAERERSVPEENIEALKKAGFFRALQPKEFGGAEVDIPAYADTIVDLAQGCASTAWVAGLLANHAHGVAPVLQTGPGRHLG